jgi:predicted transposase YdaD
MAVNTKYKDSVFSFLFSSPEILRELYCALENVTLPPDIPVIINTLQDVLYMDRINDVSFEIGGKLIVLIEHQSTINLNMCFRLLMYITRIYEKTAGAKNIYAEKKVMLPRPEFFILYNGTADYPDEVILKLSDAFEKTDTLGIPNNDTPALELMARVININHGRNREIVRECESLSEYAAFIDKIREYIKDGYSKEEAMRMAIKYCLEHDILREFLEKYGTEVYNMLLTEWNMEDAKKVWFEEGREEGREEGIETGIEKNKIEIAKNAMAMGFPIEQVHKLTGLDIETIQALSYKSSLLVLP